MKNFVKKYAMALMVFVGTGVFVTIGTLFPEEMHVAYMTTGAAPETLTAATSPLQAVHYLFSNIERRHWPEAYRLVANTQEVDYPAFAREQDGTDSSLRTFSSLDGFDAQVIDKKPDETIVRVDLRWSTAVGAFYERRDLRVVPTRNGWKIAWPVDKQVKVPPQVVPVSYARWDVPSRNDATGQINLPAPRVRILSQNLVQDADSIILIGELKNEDSVPAFVTTNATLRMKNGKQSIPESSFDNISHSLLPGEVTPFRIEFPDQRRDQVQDVNLSISSELVPASADPVIKVTEPHMENADAGEKELRGELVSQSGRPVSIAQVLASYRDASGKVVWVTSTYIDKPLLPQSPVPFAMKLPGIIAQQVKSYTVAVNSFRLEHP